MGVLVGTCVPVGVFVGVRVGVFVGVTVGVFVGVFVGVGVGGVFVGVSVGVFVGVSVGVFVGVSVGVSVGVFVGVLVGVVTMHTPGSPTAKSLEVTGVPNVVMPVACVLVDVRVPVVGLVQTALEKRWTMKLAVFAPTSRSPATKWKVPE